MNDLDRIQSMWRRDQILIVMMAFLLPIILICSLLGLSQGAFSEPTCSSTILQGTHGPQPYIIPLYDDNHFLIVWKKKSGEIKWSINPGNPLHRKLGLLEFGDVWNTNIQRKFNQTVALLENDPYHLPDNYGDENQPIIVRLFDRKKEDHGFYFVMWKNLDEIRWSIRPALIFPWRDNEKARISLYQTDFDILFNDITWKEISKYKDALKRDKFHLPDTTNLTDWCSLSTEMNYCSNTSKVQEFELGGWHCDPNRTTVYRIPANETERDWKEFLQEWCEKRSMKIVALNDRKKRIQTHFLTFPHANVIADYHKLLEPKLFEDVYHKILMH